MLYGTDRPGVTTRETRSTSCSPLARMRCFGSLRLCCGLGRVAFCEIICACDGRNVHERRGRDLNSPAVRSVLCARHQGTVFASNENYATIYF